MKSHSLVATQFGGCLTPLCHTIFLLFLLNEKEIFGEFEKSRYVQRKITHYSRFPLIRILTDVNVLARFLPASSLLFLSSLLLVENIQKSVLKFSATISRERQGAVLHHAECWKYDFSVPRDGSK